MVGDSIWAAEICANHTLPHKVCGCGMPFTGNPEYQSGVSIAMEALRKERDDLIARVSELEADRDEWHVQHENALACWKADMEVAGSRKNEAIARSKDIEAAALECVTWMKNWLPDEAKDSGAREAYKHLERTIGGDAYRSLELKIGSEAYLEHQKDVICEALGLTREQIEQCSAQGQALPAKK